MTNKRMLAIQLRPRTERPISGGLEAPGRRRPPVGFTGRGDVRVDEEGDAPIRGFHLRFSLYTGRGRPAFTRVVHRFRRVPGALFVVRRQSTPYLNYAVYPSLITCRSASCGGY